MFSKLSAAILLYVGKLGLFLLFLQYILYTLLFPTYKKSAANLYEQFFLLQQYFQKSSATEASEGVYILGKVKTIFTELKIRGI